MAGASLPLTHSTLPVGCDGSRFNVNVPSDTVARAPQRDTHKGQNVATSRDAGASLIRHLPALQLGPAGGPQSHGCVQQRRRGTFLAGSSARQTADDEVGEVMQRVVEVLRRERRE